MGLQSEVIVNATETLSDAELAAVELFKRYPDGLMIFATTAYVIIMLVGIPGNIITIFALARYKKNFALTGYFSDGRKRIDIVLVFKHDGTDEVKEIRKDFLMNIIQFGLEVEVQPGKMREHRDLIFVKLHAPDAIIEECGLYFNEKLFFKDSHLEFINPIFHPFRMANERTLIKIVRKQYPGPDNYSTLERSNIVYKILLQLPFGIYKNQFGIKKLIDNNIILDAFALHDGPYFIVPKQDKVHMNARQVLFIEWLGLVNVWKTQPIHMIHEYFGKRISYYFAFYEYFNLMLIIPCIFGAVTTFRLWNSASYNPYYERYYDFFERDGEEQRYISHYYYLNKEFLCPECRNYTLCYVMRLLSYSDEFLATQIVDKEITFLFGYFIVIWGIFSLSLWRYRERYLTWIWEGSKKFTNRLVRAEYTEYENGILKEKGATYLKMFIYILTAASFGFWIILMFRFSMLVWHYPRWARQNDDTRCFKYHENVLIVVSAGIYIMIACLIKMVFMVLAQKITDYENNETFLIYDRSIAIKLYAFSFVGSFMILINYTYLGVIHRHANTSFHDLYLFMWGYGFMNSGFGSTFDDICISLGVITLVEQVIFRIPNLLIKGKTDYPIGFNSSVPCWEREYKLKPITDSFFHKRYNALAIQFALLTCYSMMFPLATWFIFIINIWDLRHAARQLLLEYRRPMLINTSGLGFWKYLILITAFYAPLSNTAILVFQSFAFESKYFKIRDISLNNYMQINIDDLLVNLEITTNDFVEMKHFIEYEIRGDGLFLNEDPFGPRCSTTYLGAIESSIRLEMAYRYMFLATCIGAVIGFLLFYIIPGTSNALDYAIIKEQRIKNKYRAQRVPLSD